MRPVGAGIGARNLPCSGCRIPVQEENPMRKLALAVLLSLAVTPAFSISEKPYMTVADVDFATLIPPPPAESSELGRLDDQFILDAQKKMTPQKMADVQRDFAQDVFVVGEPVLGPNFNKEKL